MENVYITEFVQYHYSYISLCQVAEKILLHLDNAYNILNLRGRSAACKTNLPSNTAFRGFGVPQCMLVIESMIDDVALKLGRLPEEVGVMQSQNDVLLLACLHHYTSYYY